MGILVTMHKLSVTGVFAALKRNYDLNKCLLKDIIGRHGCVQQT